MSSELYITSPENPGQNFAGTILIVDDFEAHLEVLTAVLEQEGYKVIAAKDGNEALSRVYELSPDMAILDILMPGIGGLDLCRSLKGIYKNRFFPVILLTGLSQPDDRIDGIDAGADEYYTKPFSPREMVKKIKSLFQFKKLRDELDFYEDVIFKLAISSEGRIGFMKGHSERVSVIASHMAFELKCTDAQISVIRRGGILHDIGMSGIDDVTIYKKGALSSEEHENVKTHTVDGYKLFKDLPSLGGVLKVIKYHHERWDGKGYPIGLKADAIPLEARIISVADAFDAMVSERPYRKKLSFSEAVSAIVSSKKSGQWDPDIVDVLQAIAGDKADFDKHISGIYGREI